MNGLFLIRAELRRNAAVSALAPLLMPPEQDVRTLASHRLVWSLLADGADRKRDFLWREQAPGHFLILASRPPQRSDLFEVKYKDFAPQLCVGERLQFMLRANATVSPRRANGKRADVVMAGLHGLPPTERAEARRRLIEQRGATWLERLGPLHGFSLEPDRLRVDGYQRVRIPRPGEKPIVLGTLDFDGVLEIHDPAQFLTGLRQGFGRGRAFGCGLMLIRRAG